MRHNVISPFSSYCRLVSSMNIWNIFIGDNRFPSILSKYDAFFLTPIFSLHLIIFISLMFEATSNYGNGEKESNKLVFASPTHALIIVVVLKNLFLLLEHFRSFVA